MEKSEIIELFSKQLITNECSVCTKKSYMHSINLFLDYIAEKEYCVMDENAIISFIEDCKIKRNFSCSSIRLVMASIRFLFRHVFNKDINFSCFVKIKREVVLPVILTRGEIKSLLNSYSNLKHLAIISTLYSCGLRLSELINLKIIDVDFCCSLITITDPGGKNNRQIPMLSVRLQKLLKDYINKYHPKCYLFEGNKGIKYSRRGIQAIFEKGIKTAGITKNVSVYTVRHSFASHLLDNGTDIKYLQILLGHKHLSTTQIYLQVSPFSFTKIKNPLDTL